MRRPVSIRVSGWGRARSRRGAVSWLRPEFLLLASFVTTLTMPLASSAAPRPRVAGATTVVGKPPPLAKRATFRVKAAPAVTLSAADEGTVVKAAPVLPHDP